MPSRLQSICVFAGSRSGTEPAHEELARQLGRALAAMQIRLVYGGGSVGLMGAVANAALADGGTVIGVIPKAMVEREWAHRHLSELHITADMHERKATMARLSDAFIALPGGIGTLEELFEMMSGAYLQFHRKPIALLDNTNYYRPVVDMLDSVVQAGFMARSTAELLMHTRGVDDALNCLTAALA